MDSFLAFTILVSAGSLVVLALILFAEYRKLDELESYFSENKLVQDRKRFWGKNQRVDRFHRMALMVDLLSMAKRHVKAGVVTEAELAAVPLSLKRWALLPYRFGMLWAVGIGVWEVWRWWCNIPIP